ncbi:ferric iron reductase [Saccharibacillus sp. O23]|uniref:ferric iron reductase n=1 Tax=Saccharibacillus sp. O23 TaxID=2009338 RepID=UPI000B4E1330|nr:ferric iron reductase [Saccharibacillus sp. O23]OWR32324.1 ferric iron reductase [Saccharibacillus sp. O23]
MEHYLAAEAWRRTAADHSIRLGEPPSDSVRTIALSELKEEAACLAYVSWFRDYIDAPDLQVAASMLAKRLGYLWTAPLVTALTFHRQHVSLDLQSSFLYHPVLAEEGMTRFPFLAVGEVRSEPLTGSPEARRTAAIEEMFAMQLTPILKMLSKIAPLPMSILWENIMVRIGPLYRMEEEYDAREKERLQADFAYLTQEAPGAVFDQRKNPFTRFTTCEDEVPVARSERLTCCFYYRMSNEYCRKCPKIDTENISQLK